MANTTNVGDVSVEYPAEGVGMVVINNPPMNMWYLGLAKKMSDGMDEVRESGAKVLILASDTPGYFLAHMSLQDSIDIAEGRDPTGDFVGMAKCGAELRLGTDGLDRRQQRPVLGRRLRALLDRQPARRR